MKKQNKKTNRNFLQYYLFFAVILVLFLLKKKQKPEIKERNILVEADYTEQNTFPTNTEQLTIQLDDKEAAFIQEGTLLMMETVNGLVKIGTITQIFSKITQEGSYLGEKNSVTLIIQKNNKYVINDITRMIYVYGHQMILSNNFGLEKLKIDINWQNSSSDSIWSKTQLIFKSKIPNIQSVSYTTRGIFYNYDPWIDTGNKSNKITEKIEGQGVEENSFKKIEKNEKIFESNRIGNLYSFNNQQVTLVYENEKDNTFYYKIDPYWWWTGTYWLRIQGIWNEFKVEEVKDKDDQIIKIETLDFLDNNSFIIPSTVPIPSYNQGNYNTLNPQSMIKKMKFNIISFKDVSYYIAPLHNFHMPGNLYKDNLDIRPVNYETMKAFTKGGTELTDIMYNIALDIIVIKTEKNYKGVFVVDKLPNMGETYRADDNEMKFNKITNIFSNFNGNYTELSGELIHSVSSAVGMILGAANFKSDPEDKDKWRGATFKTSNEIIIANSANYIEGLQLSVNLHSALSSIISNDDRYMRTIPIPEVSEDRQMGLGKKVYDNVYYYDEIIFPVLKNSEGKEFTDSLEIIINNGTVESFNNFPQGCKIIDYLSVSDTSDSSVRVKKTLISKGIFFADVSDTSNPKYIPAPKTRAELDSMIKLNQCLLSAAEREALKGNTALISRGGIGGYSGYFRSKVESVIALGGAGVIVTNTSDENLYMAWDGAMDNSEFPRPLVMSVRKTVGESISASPLAPFTLLFSDVTLKIINEMEKSLKKQFIPEKEWHKEYLTVDDDNYIDPLEFGIKFNNIQTIQTENRLIVGVEDTLNITFLNPITGEIAHSFTINDFDFKTYNKTNLFPITEGSKTQFKGGKKNTCNQ